MSKRILFVCLGNICRSPTAEAVARQKAQQQGLDWRFDSAGTSDWHVGDPPYGAMQVAAKQAGYDMSSLRARQVAVQDFDRFDAIIAMDSDNLANLRRLQPKDSRAALHLFTDFQQDPSQDHVPDPYYTRNFDGALRLVEACAEGLLKQIG